MDANSCNGRNWGDAVSFVHQILQSSKRKCHFGKLSLGAGEGIIMTPLDADNEDYFVKIAFYYVNVYFE